MGLIQLLREETRVNVVGRRPDADKQTRMSRQLGRFEAGRILLPSEAPWLADFEKELLDFPGGRYDDQVDALLLFLELNTTKFDGGFRSARDNVLDSLDTAIKEYPDYAWFAQNEHCHQPMTFCAPIIVRRESRWNWDAPMHDEWSPRW